MLSEHALHTISQVSVYTLEKTKKVNKQTNSDQSWKLSTTTIIENVIIKNFNLKRKLKIIITILLLLLIIIITTTKRGTEITRFPMRTKANVQAGYAFPKMFSQERFSNDLQGKQIKKEFASIKSSILLNFQFDDLIRRKNSLVETDHSEEEIDECEFSRSFYRSFYRKDLES